ncbi:MAG: hypothetical protein KAT34_13370 [Candidatus Aminicenantes bacterium]|nr:hypothetical protein [Candidatus Aminicenantes bacterium]
MKSKFIISLLTIVLIFNVGCFNNRLNTISDRVTDLEKMLIEIMTHNKIEQSLRSDANNSKLTSEMAELDKAEKIAVKKFNIYSIKDKKKFKSREIKQAIKRIYDISRQKYEIIQSEYDIIDIDFKDFNGIYIPRQEKEKLEKIKQRLNNICGLKNRIIIYGFGCFKGNKNQIRNVSTQRAKSVHDWIMKNTKCPRSPKLVFYKGLGIYIIEEDIKNFSDKSKEDLVSRSRCAKIFLPLE